MGDYTLRTQIKARRAGWNRSMSDLHCCRQLSRLAGQGKAALNASLRVCAQSFAASGVRLGYEDTVPKNKARLALLVFYLHCYSLSANPRGARDDEVQCRSFDCAIRRAANQRRQPIFQHGGIHAKHLGSRLHAKVIWKVALLSYRDPNFLLSGS